MDTWTTVGLAQGAMAARAKEREQYLESIVNGTGYVRSNEELQGQAQTILYDVAAEAGKSSAPLFQQYSRVRELRVGIELGVYRTAWFGLDPRWLEAYHTFERLADGIETKARAQATQEQLAGIDALAMNSLTGHTMGWASKIAAGMKELAAAHAQALNSKFSAEDNQAQANSSRRFAEWKSQSASNAKQARVKDAIFWASACVAGLISFYGFRHWHWYWACAVTLGVAFVVFVVYSQIEEWRHNMAKQKMSADELTLDNRLRAIHAVIEEQKDLAVAEVEKVTKTLSWGNLEPDVQGALLRRWARIAEEVSKKFGLSSSGNVLAAHVDLALLESGFCYTKLGLPCGAPIQAFLKLDVASAEQLAAAKLAAGGKPA